jgi:hypothetical protein
LSNVKLEREREREREREKQGETEGICYIQKLEEVSEKIQELVFEEYF